MKICSCFLLLTGICFSAFQQIKAQVDLVTPTLPSIPNKIFSVKEFGAMGDNQMDNTVAIQNAINAANTAGGGKVVVPAGIYLCGPLQFVSNLNLQLDL